MQNHVVRMNEKKKKFGEYLLHNFPNTENDMFLTNAHNGTMIMIDEATLQLRSKSGKILQDAIIAVSKDVEMITEKITEELWQFTEGIVDMDTKWAIKRVRV